MAQRYAVSYFGNRFGSVICNQRSFTSGREVTSFSVKICCPDGFPHHSPTFGNVVGNKCRTPVYGGIWLSKPSGAQAPDFRSTNSVNLNDGYKFDRNTDADSSSVPYTTFNFKNAICNKSTIYAGLYTPLNDTVNSVLAYVGDSDITLCTWNQFDDATGKIDKNHVYAKLKQIPRQSKPGPRFAEVAKVLTIFI